MSESLSSDRERDWALGTVWAQVQLELKHPKNECNICEPEG